MLLKYDFVSPFIHHLCPLFYKILCRLLPLPEMFSYCPDASLITKMTGCSIVGSVIIWRIVSPSFYNAVHNCVNNSTKVTAFETYFSSFSLCNNSSSLHSCLLSPSPQLFLSLPFLLSSYPRRLLLSPLCSLPSSRKVPSLPHLPRVCNSPLANSSRLFAYPRWIYIELVSGLISLQTMQIAACSE